jgi:hypothetical protein
MLWPMAALSLRFSLRSRRLVAMLTAVLLIVLQAFAVAPAHAHAGPGVSTAAAICGAGDADAPPTPCADPCLLCAASVAMPAPARLRHEPVRRVESTPAAQAPARLSRAPPGWASSWSSQAPPGVR